ncbi:MAG: 50S ribosomal protein L21 [Candidatus Omnitrophota bacterium]|nr:50S ribosomal protein L21 [bacterium]MDO9513114.1 50S ribosomal protein L21 [Elusimicrobiota bacterium]
MSDIKDYAVIDGGGKQYFVSVGDKVELDNEGLESIDKVLLVKTGDKILIGEPVLSGAKVGLKFIGAQKAPKVISFKKKRRKGYRRKIGHRQQYFVYEVKDIKTAA